MILSTNKEDYLKALFHLTEKDVEQRAGINQLAEYLSISAASVNNMLKKLKTDGLVDYEKYGKVELSEKGRLYALKLIRKHRIWETFLYRKLNFTWDEVHEVAEQLEHIQSDKLIDRLDALLGHPSTDPHGEQIPAADGSLVPRPKIKLTNVIPGTLCQLMFVEDSSSEFLQYVTRIGLSLQKQFKVLEHQTFDDSLLLKIDDREVWVSQKFAENIYVSDLSESV